MSKSQFLRRKGIAAIRSFRELRVYQMAFEVALDIFRVSRAWSADERYSLTDQIRRSSRSVCGAVAEAWGNRRYSGAFTNKLNLAISEANETEVWLDFALALNYISREAV
jgi:four helix bundle protein